MKVVILYKAEIIRTGLESIIHRILDADVVSCSSTEAFRKIVETNEKYSIYLIQEEFYPLIKQIKDFDINKVLEVGGALDRYSEENYIHFNCELSEIQSKVSRLNDIVKQRSNVHTNVLTQREEDVLRELVYGYSNKEIADKLSISAHTVITHRKNIASKLGIKSVSGLAVYALLNHIIDPDTINPEDLI
ncbi:MAG: LuxR C-terminal-related transcriptional regulator [Bacteroidales bacterium]|nr:LuxR C-terminal-related transcriptional regulator [Bacteroidales bacterium]